jgi:threonine/homoserine/homoserine lactone efflux protein
LSRGRITSGFLTQALNPKAWLVALSGVTLFALPHPDAQRTLWLFCAVSFVACMAGVGRSSTLVLAHLLAGRFRDATAEDALAFLSARRPVVRPNPRQLDAAREAARTFAG